MDALRLTPGVAGPAFANQLPAFCGGSGTAIYVEGRPEDALGQRVCLVGPHRSSFDDADPAPRRPVLNESDTQGEPLMVVINKAAARASWPGRAPIGASGRLGQPTAPGSMSSASSAM